MSLGAPKGRLGRAYEAHLKRLQKDAIRYARATAAFGPPTPQQRISVEMMNALARWLADAQKARARMEQLPASVKGRGLAIQALTTLHEALTQLAYSIQMTDAAQAEAAAATAEAGMKRWEKLSKDLQGRLG